MLRYVFALVGALTVVTADVQAQYMCRTEFRNNVQGAVITNIACQYYYRPSGTSLDSHRTSIGYHENGYCYSRDDVSCVARGSTAVLVMYNGQESAYTNDIPDAGQDQCWQVMPVQELNPASRLKMGAEKKHSIRDVLEVYNIDPETGTRTKAKVRWFKTLDEATAYLQKQAEARK